MDEDCISCGDETFYEEESLPEALIRIAQNDYMIDVGYLPDGLLLLDAANEIIRLRSKTLG